ncbi:outer membrane efflux protein [Bacteroides pyogenes JCM 6292]|uniref:Outer membrane efflux protein n=1 Tax=Bacteroides pyogenes JCM 6292 TaxID=1235809 RepID=W4PA50_9BACE|nr:outer membrane efflux protein [Bacteroides pyogenes JCM 6292]
MKKVLILTFICCLASMVKGQSVLNLDSCRALALANNKDLLISNEKIEAAYNQKKAAFTNYLPDITATGAYMRNQKEFSILNNDQKAALSGLGTNMANSIAGPFQEAAQAIVIAHPEMAPLISSLGNLGQQLGSSLVPALNNAGNSIIDAFRTDTRNVYAGALTLTQPSIWEGKYVPTTKSPNMRKS